MGNSYTETQLGEDGINRLVWMFSIRLIPENDVKKTSMFAFMDMEDYITRGKNVDDKYNAGHKVKAVKKSPGKSAQKDWHKKFRLGTVVERKDEFIIVQFEKMALKQLNEKVCVEKGLIEEV